LFKGSIPEDSRHAFPTMAALRSPPPLDNGCDAIGPG
jgi:hypothetical protein